MNVLLDENCALPMRELIGGLLACADTAVFAVTNVRLAALDLAATETQRVRSCRILLRRLEYGELGRLEGGSRRFADLRNFITSDRVEIRSAGIGDWCPDFSVFSGCMGTVCVIGAHYFHDPPAAQGPSFSCVLADHTAASRALRRFEELWEGAHDVRPVVIAALDALQYVQPATQPQPDAASGA
jgi:hypothetical protein